MESVQQLKSRRRAVANVSQITKAMEMVSAVKMRKSQEAALNSRPYAYAVLELLEKISAMPDAVLLHELAQKREVKKRLYVVIASDKGFTGSFNAQVLRLFEKISRNSENFCVAAVGKKSADYATKKNMEVVAAFSGFGDFVLPEEAEPLAEFVTSGFRKGKWDEVVSVSTHFRTALLQEPLVRQLLPLDAGKVKEAVEDIVPERGKYAEAPPSLKSGAEREEEYIFEPSPKEALGALLPYLFKIQIYHLILEANASEHSARRVAMKTASDNADELASELLLAFNKLRQAGITNEIIEITGTQNAL